MAYIESHQTLGEHRKTKRAAKALAISRAAIVGHLHFLWWWALDHAEDGDLSGFTDEEIAEEAEWEGDPCEFVATLRAVGFIDADGCIHDWPDYTGRLVAQREGNRERQRRFREKRRDNESECDVTVTSQLRNGATVPNRTVTNQTVTTTPPTPPTGGESSSWLLDLIDGRTAKVAADFVRVNPHLSTAWLESVLVEAGDRAPPAWAWDDLKTALRTAHVRIEDAFGRESPEKPIRNPPGFARKLVLAAIDEQAARAP